MLWAGVDLGTTHMKALLYDDAERRVIELATAPTPVRSDGRFASRDADEVVRAALTLLARILAPPGRAERLGGISVAALGEEIVTLDEDGRPTGEVLAWYDPRGREEAEALRSGSPPALHGRVAMDASYSLFKLLWLRGHRPAEFARIALIADPSAYLLVRLGAPPTADWSHASRTALFDPWRTAWDDECVAAAGLPASALPELVPSGTVVGRAKSAAAVGAGIPAGTPLVAGGHDHLCGAYASGVREPGDLYLSAGTSEAQLILAEAAGASAAAAASGFDVGRYVDDVHWYLHVGRPLGQAYRKWRELLFGDAEDGVIEAEIEAAIGADAGILFDPPSLGAGAMLSGLPLTASRGSILRAVVEGSAMASAGVTRRLGDAAGEGSGAIVVSGHAAHSALWRGLRAGLTGRAMEIVDEPEAAALGAALLAQRAVTGRADPDVVSRTRYAPSAADLALAAHLEARYAGNAVSPSYSRADAQ